MTALIRAHPVAGLLAGICLMPGPAPAQTLVGRVLEEGRESPIAGVVISLLDEHGEARASATSDSVGRFVLTPPAPDQYSVEAVRLGYHTTRSPLFALGSDGRVAFDVMMNARPIGLEGFEVSVDRRAEELLGIFGLTPARLGNRWIDRDRIEAMTMPGGPKEVIRWQGISGVWTYEDDAQLCVTFRRGRTALGNDRCGLVVLDGQVILPELSLEVVKMDAHEIESIAVLTPVEATTFYGTIGGGGAVLLWTRRGGR